MKPEDEKTEAEKLGEQIIELKNKIKNTEYDLEHMFKGNALVQQKLGNAKISLDQKQKLLESLSQADAPTTKPELVPESEEEPNEEPTVGEDQKDKIDQEMEKEFW